MAKSSSNKKVIKRINRKVKELKKKIKDEFDKAMELAPREGEAVLKGYLKAYWIDGKEGIDPNTFIVRIKPNGLKLIRGKEKPIKLKFNFACSFTKEDPATGQLDTSFGNFSNKQ